MSPLVICIAAFIGVTALVGGVAVLLRGGAEEKLEGRLDQLTSGKSAAATNESIVKQGVLEVMAARGDILRRLTERFARLGLLFEQAGTSLTLDKFLLISAALAVAAAVTVVVAQLHISIAPFAAAFGGILPLMWLLWKRKRRFRQFGAQLSDALELMSRALRAGHSLAAGFQLVGSEVREPLGTEFGHVFEQQNLGIPLEEALESMTERVPNLDLKFFCTAVILQRQTGGDLAEILDKIGRLIRERFKIFGQIQALTGEGRLSGVVLLGLPPLLFLAVYKLNPDYIMVLFTDPLGQKMLGVAVVLQLLGAAVIKKIVNIKV